MDWGLQLSADLHQEIRECGVSREAEKVAVPLLAKSGESYKDYHCPVPV